MAKFSKTKQHDYMRFKITFTDKTVLAGNYSRNGHTINLQPYSPAVARKVSNIFSNIDTAVRASDILNLGQLFDIIEPIALEAKSLDTFLAGITNKIQKQYGIDVNAPSMRETYDQTTVETEKKRGAKIIKVLFENGERTELTLNKRSVGFRMVPDHSLFASKIASMALGLLEMSDNEDIAERLIDAAEGAPNIESWIENISNGFSLNANQPLSSPKM